MPGREFACEDITVTDCTFLHGHGMSIGSETTGGVRNVTVKNCTFENTENGIRIKSQRGKGGIVENLEYRDLTMRNVDPAITFTCYYMNNSAKDPGEPTVQPAAGDNDPVYRNIRISNLDATCERSAGIILGMPQSTISNVSFSNVHIAAATGLTVRNARGIALNDVKIIAKSGPPFITENAEITGQATATVEAAK
jgi:polygalacturonase